MPKALLSNRIQRVMTPSQDQRAREDQVIAKTFTETLKQVTIFTGTTLTSTTKAINRNRRELEASTAEEVTANNKVNRIRTQATRLNGASMSKPKTITAPKPTGKSPTGKTCTISGKRIRKISKSNREKLTNLATLRKRKSGLEDTQKRKKPFIRNTGTEGPTIANKTTRAGPHQTLGMNITTQSQISMPSSMESTRKRNKRYTRNMRLVKTLILISKIEAIRPGQICLTDGIGFPGFS